jgi:hypothetical protein
MIKAIFSVLLHLGWDDLLNIGISYTALNAQRTGYQLFRAIFDVLGGELGLFHMTWRKSFEFAAVVVPILKGLCQIFIRSVEYLKSFEFGPGPLLLLYSSLLIMFSLGSRW